MRAIAYLAPVGPFAGFSNAARHKLAKCYPGLCIAEIERAAERFSLELQAPKVERRLSEARNELNVFSNELARFQSAVDNLRNHQLDEAIGHASRMTGGDAGLEGLDRTLANLRRAIQETSRALPLEGAQLASRRLVATLARHISEAGLPRTGSTSDLLFSLVDLIFDDLMVGGDARSAFREWSRSQSTNKSDDPVGVLIELVVS